MDFETFLTVVADLTDPGLSEDRDIETRRVLGVTVEPQARGDLLRIRYSLLPCKLRPN
jgi:hypothetical protein